MKIEQFLKESRSFVSFYTRIVKPSEIVYVALPKPNQNHRGINDIGWQCDSDFVKLYGTLASESGIKDAIWEEIPSGYAINKTTSLLKIVNEGENEARIIVKSSLF